MIPRNLRNNTTRRKRFTDDVKNDEILSIDTDEDNEEIDDIRRILGGFGFEYDGKNRLDNTNEIDDLILKNLVIIKGRKNHNILAVDITKSEYEMLKRKRKLPKIEKFEHNLKVNINEEPVNISTNNNIEKYFAKIYENKDMFDKLLNDFNNLTCFPKNLYTALSSKFSIECMTNENTLKYDVFDAFMTNNNLKTKEEYIQKFFDELQQINDIKSFPNAIKKEFVMAFNMLKELSTEDIEDYKVLINK